MSDSGLTSLGEYVTAAVAGSLVVQIAQADNPDYNVIAIDDSAIRHYAKQLANQGIDPYRLCQHILMSLQVLYGCDENSEILRNSISLLLWQILGDPASGAPPEIYKKAARQIHRYFMSLHDEAHLIAPQ